MKNYIIKYYSKSHKKTRYFMRDLLDIPVSELDLSEDKLQVLDEHGIEYVKKPKFSYEEKHAYRYKSEPLATKDVMILNQTGYKGLEIVEVEPLVKLVASNETPKEPDEDEEPKVGLVELTKGEIFSSDN